MGFFETVWLIIKGIVLKWVISLFYISPNYVQASNNKNYVRSENGDGEGELPEGLRHELMPQHVAVILDGNRRWANQRGLSYVEGYEAGVGAMMEFIEMSTKFNIPVVSLFAFSSENWRRPKDEVNFLMDLFERNDYHYVIRNLYCSRGARVTVIGDMSLFPISLQKVVKEIEEETKDNTKLHVILAMSYSGQNDIVQACQSIANKVKEGLLEPVDVTSTLIQQELLTKISDIPNPDLLIRTSGELRISNFYLWQSAYTEMYFTNIHWPDFGEVDFVEALRSFQLRGRRFGRI
ncbi:cis-prenyltransferase 4, chloroplastic-like [Silene latifolia]|uniref:cis-prenyltransferase 4, chloroplastic-like n=1 Tax=Silene latifolia TaxID=37657 RepID=UPI003D77EF80